MPLHRIPLCAPTPGAAIALGKLVLSHTTGSLLAEEARREEEEKRA